jgi:penicillin-binding protein 2
MFERRIKIFLAILIVFAVLLLVRALQVQVLQRNDWSKEAIRVMTRPELIDTSRGRIMDRKGRPIAEDRACIDACVDYRAISLDEAWIKDLAEQRLRARMGAEYRRSEKATRDQLLKEEIARVHTDIRIMWEKLAQLSNQSADDIDQVRLSIIRKVEMRRRFVWYRKYQLAVKDQENREPSPWYKRFLIDDTQSAPELENFELVVAEQTQPHVILRAISNETNNYLGKNLERFPGLVLQPSMHRYYPYLDAGSQLIGHLTRVAAGDVEKDPNIGNELRNYLPNDLIGRTGLEALCEPRLRGMRGRIERYVGENTRILDNRAPVPGDDVRTTIDIELQTDVQAAFKDIVIDHLSAPVYHDHLAMPGAAVVIDIASNEVLALASYPGYDNNDLDDLYSSLVADEINRPLMNRATQFALEPGSTVKPMVGLGAITQGLLPIDGTIECTGYLQLNNHVYKTEGRCWVASNFGEVLRNMGMTPAHHPIPTDAPHPTGLLTFPDALQRSCNVFFETLADRLGEDGLRYWFDRFGLGRPTGIGIAEVGGKIPGDDHVPAFRRRAMVWFSGIGQAQVLATPIQMANVAATIARGGVWMRPHLIPSSDPLAKTIGEGPDRVDLKLNPAALAAAKEGMKRVVNTRAGTGTSMHREDMLVAGKTGSAQAAPLRRVMRDPITKKVIMRTIEVPVQDEKGKVTLVQREIPKLEPIPLGTHDNPTEEALWYRGYGDAEDKRSHAWVIGFAPADHPRIAFAVMVEYGGGGGATAGYVARKMLDACIEHGYLSPSVNASPEMAAGQP